MFRTQNGNLNISLLAGFACLGTVVGCDLDRTPGVQATTTPVIGPMSNLNEFFDCLEAEGITLISAHRGGVPENSLAGMNQTMKQVPAIMEIDVATSSDGVLLLMHDDSLNRTTTGRGPVIDHDWDEIKSLNLRANGRTLPNDHPPSFADVLSWADGKTLIQVDFKRSTKYEDVVAEVQRQNATNRVIYIAYTYAQAKKLHHLHPEAMISLTIDETTDLPEAFELGIPTNNIIAWTGNTTPDEDVFRLLNEKDIEVIFGTLGGGTSIDNQIAETGDEARYARIAEQGVDIIATDRPIEAYAALKRAGMKTDSVTCGVPN